MRDFPECLEEFETKSPSAQIIVTLGSWTVSESEGRKQSETPDTVRERAELAHSRCSEDVTSQLSHGSSSSPLKICLGEKLW